MEKASWVDWRSDAAADTEAERCYFGHETCQELLPPPRIAGELVRRLFGQGKRVTLVTPFLTDRGIDLACGLVERLLAQDSQLEVVCSDWGLLAMLGQGGLVRPVMGRALAMQASDPRISRMLDARRPWPSRPVQHVDGTTCSLRYRPPSPTLEHHLRSCWMDRQDIIEFLVSLGVQRCEISNVSQGMELAQHPKWAYSLHVPDVLLAVMRRCPAAGENLNAAACLRESDVPGSCGGPCVPWSVEGLPAGVFRRDNALYYRNSRLPTEMASLPFDRIVYRHRG